MAVWHGGDLFQVQHVLGGQQRGQPLEEEILMNKEVKMDPDKLFHCVDSHKELPCRQLVGDVGLSSP